MKASDLLIYILGIAGALAGYFVLQPPLSWAAVGICAAFTAWTLLAADAATQPVLRLAGLSWSMEDFVRGWLITGRTGSGKTQCAINTITYQIFQNVPHWGGVCLDQKGLYWEILMKMAAHFGREGDLVLLQTRPLGKDQLWLARPHDQHYGQPERSRLDVCQSHRGYRRLADWRPRTESVLPDQGANRDSDRI